MPSSHLETMAGDWHGGGLAWRGIGIDKGARTVIPSGQLDTHHGRTHPQPPTFANLAQSQRVMLDYGANSYDFVVNYYGGTGNDLVLQWAEREVLAWGCNIQGQLGNGGGDAGLVPSMVDQTGVLAGRKRVGQLGTAAGVGGMGGDGIADLVRYSFQLDPQRPVAEQLPQAPMLAGEYLLAFTQPAGIDDIIYGAEWSATMRPGSWQQLPDTGSGSYHRFAIPVAGAPQGFIRLKVTRQWNACSRSMSIDAHERRAS